MRKNESLFRLNGIFKVAVIIALSVLITKFIPILAIPILVLAIVLSLTIILLITFAGSPRFFIGLLGDNGIVKVLFKANNVIGLLNPSVFNE